MVSASRGRGAAAVRHVDVKEERKWPVIFSAQGAFTVCRSVPRRETPSSPPTAAGASARRENITPDLLLGDFDSLHTVPDFARIRRVPVEKDDTDMMLAIKEGLGRGETEFHSTAAWAAAPTIPLPTFRACCIWRTTAHRAGCTVTGSGSPPSGTAASPCPPGKRGIVSVFCMGADSQGVTIEGGQYTVHDAGADVVISSGCQQSLCGQPCPRHRDAGQFADSIDRKGVNKHEKERTE